LVAMYGAPEMALREADPAVGIQQAGGRVDRSDGFDAASGRSPRLWPIHSPPCGTALRSALLKSSIGRHGVKRADEAGGEL
jgi:hypothetical protein